MALVTWLATWATAVASLAVGGRVAAWQCGIGVACGVASLWDRRLGWPWRLVTLVMAVALTAVALALSLLAPDLTFDANLYHFPAAFALADGWNPIWERWDPVVAQSVSINCDEIVRCYPKAVAVWYCAMHDWIANIDAGRALAFWLLLAPAGPAFAFFRTMLRHRASVAGAATALVCANPVALSQMTTGYIDVYVSTLVTTLLFSALLAVGKGWRGAAALAAMATALLIGTKFTGLVYACVIATVVVLWALAGRRRWPRTFVTRAALGIGLGLVLAFDSYALNAHAYGNPFFPAWQPGKVTVIDSQASPAFLARNRVDKLVRSLGAPQADAGVEHRIDPEIRIPFTQVRWEPRHEARFSGFGPLFWEALLLSGAALLARRRTASTVALIAVLASTLATDAAWWARLAPQIWLLPILLVMVGSRSPAPKRASVLRRLHGLAVFALLGVNLWIMGGAIEREARRASDWWYLRALQLDSSPDASLTHEDVGRSFRRRLHELQAANGITPGTGTAPSHNRPRWRERLALGLGLWADSRWSGARPRAGN